MSAGQAHGGSVVRITAVAMLIVVIAVTPPFLVGASGVFVRGELGFDEAGLGLAVASFFVVSALTSVWGGRTVERIGTGRAFRVSAVASALLLLAVALLAHSLIGLALLLGIGGIINGLAQPASNLALARLPTTRPAFLFGAKQAAIPAATLASGASVPLIGLTVGWRWSFVLAAATALALASQVPRMPRADTAPSDPGVEVRPDAEPAPMAALAIAAGVGIAAATALASFLVESAVVGGMSVAGAGWLLAGGSLAGITARMCMGWYADRPGVRAMLLVTVMLTVGAGGYGLLAVDGSVATSLGTIIAYAGAWGWTGLLMFAVVRLNPSAPAAATGVIQAGSSAGAAAGPFAFGLVVSRTTTFTVGWICAAVAALVAAVLVFGSRTWLLRD